MERLRTLKLFSKFKIKNKKLKTYSGWCPFKGLFNDTTLMQIQSGRTVPLTGEIKLGSGNTIDFRGFFVWRHHANFFASFNRRFVETLLPILCLNIGVPVWYTLYCTYDIFSRLCELWQMGEYFFLTDFLKIIPSSMRTTFYF